MALNKWNENYKIGLQEPNIFSRTGKKIEEIKKALSYELPKAEKVVTLKGNEGVEKLRYEKYINEDNFRLQIGKMQKDGNTIYSPLMLRFGLEYIANHVNTDKEGKFKAIIQLRPDLAQYLLQEDKEILTFEEEKKEIEKLIKKTLGKKGKFIEIQNVADNYPDVFNAIKNGRRGIIPSKEPILENIKLPLESPLPIIKFLAYNAKNDPNLMDVFYKTKPAKYIGQDVQNSVKPGNSDADYYSIVEVGIRLFEILNGITIQGGIGRQRVYDKIISLIIFGKDKIGKSKDYGINSILKLEDYPALKNLHSRLVNSGVYNDVKMNQLYIELNEKSIDGFKEGLGKKKRYSSKFKTLGTGLALAGALTLGGVKSINTTIEHNKQKKVDYTYTERESKQSSNSEGTFYLQETNELISALSLDELDNDSKQIIVDLFNMYIKNNKINQSTNAELIRGFWQEYGGILIKNFKLKHSPYDFVNNDIITPELIRTTKNINQEIPLTPNRFYGNDLVGQEGFRYSYGKYQISRLKSPFEYDDGGKKYIILQVKIGDIGNNTKWVYLAQEEHKKRGKTFCDVYELSTDTINEIQDKTGLDNAIISNTNNLKGNFIINCPIVYGFKNRIQTTMERSPRDIRNENDDQVINLDNGRRSKITTTYLENLGFYYVITVPTKSGKHVGLASESKFGPFTTTTFNKMAEEFSKTWKL